MRIRRFFLITAVATAWGCLPTELPAEEDVPRKEAVLLVAHPAMTDLRFAETVVLVTFPPDAGPMGVVLNKPSLVELRTIWPDHPGRQGRTDIIHFGGPVEPDGLLFLFRMAPAPKRAVWVTDDIYFSGDGKLLDQLLTEPRPVAHQRFFAGYAGWAPGQLENEIDWGGWYVLPVDEEVIFDMPVADMWERMLERATLPRASVDARSCTAET
jgi:putative transcriptional regulator